MRAYRKHLRMAGICGGGARDWWKLHDFNWSDFLANGIPIETLLETGDPSAIKVVEMARKDQNG